MYLCGTSLLCAHPWFCLLCRVSSPEAVSCTQSLETPKLASWQRGRQGWRVWLSQGCVLLTLLQCSRQTINDLQRRNLTVWCRTAHRTWLDLQPRENSLCWPCSSMSVSQSGFHFLIRVPSRVSSEWIQLYGTEIDCKFCIRRSSQTKCITHI